MSIFSNEFLNVDVIIELNHGFHPPALKDFFPWTLQG